MIDVEKGIRTALKAKDNVSLTAYRSVKAKMGVKKSESGREPGKPLTEDETHAIVRREIKERREANEYRDVSDPEYAFDQNVAAVLEKHLPQALSPEETDGLIERTLAELQPSGPKEMGKVMAALRQAHSGLDMGYASRKVKELLAAMSEKACDQNNLRGN